MNRVPRLLVLSSVLACHPGPSSTPPTIPNAPTPTVTAPAAEPAEASPPTRATPNVVTTRRADEDAIWVRLGTEVDDGMRTVIGRYASIRLADSGDPIADGGGAPAFDDAEVLEVQGDRIRVVTRGLSGWSTLALWIDAADAAPQIARATTLLPDAKASTRPEVGTIELAPGELVDILERGPTHAKVGTRDGTYVGWVALDALAPTFTNARFELPNLTAETKPGTALARTPGGKTFFTLPGPPEGAQLVEALTKPKNGWLRIEYMELCRPTVRIRGWVRAASTKLIGDMGTGFGCGGGRGPLVGDWGDLAKAPSMKVPKDTELRTKDGVLFGRARGEVELRQAGDGTWRVLTRWGALPVVARPPG